MEGGWVRGRVSALGINISTRRHRRCRLLLLCVWAGSQLSHSWWTAARSRLTTLNVFSCSSTGRISEVNKAYLLVTLTEICIWFCYNHIARVFNSSPRPSRTVRPIYRTGVPLPSRCCILYIFSTNISIEYFKHAAHSPFFSSKCRLFHNSTFFGSCIIHTLHTGCAKI